MPKPIFIMETLTQIKLGDKIKFTSEKQKYTVWALNSRFIICTKPFNLKNTVIYSIIDLVRNVRGAENLVFSHGFISDQECAEALERLQSGKSEVSYRNCIELDIEQINP